MRLSDVVVARHHEEDVIELFMARIRATPDAFDVGYDRCHVDDGSSGATPAPGGREPAAERSR